MCVLHSDHTLRMCAASCHCVCFTARYTKQGGHFDTALVQHTVHIRSGIALNTALSCNVHNYHVTCCCLLHFTLLQICGGPNALSLVSTTLLLACWLSAPKPATLQGTCCSAQQIPHPAGVSLSTMHCAPCFKSTTVSIPAWPASTCCPHRIIAVTLSYAKPHPSAAACIGKICFTFHLSLPHSPFPPSSFPRCICVQYYDPTFVAPTPPSPVPVGALSVLNITALGECTNVWPCVINPLITPIYCS
jgi:hypothetical protein